MRAAATISGFEGRILRIWQNRAMTEKVVRSQRAEIARLFGRGDGIDAREGRSV